MRVLMVNRRTELREEEMGGGVLADSARNSS